jgi:hypothetical protein
MTMTMTKSWRGACRVIAVAAVAASLLGVGNPAEAQLVDNSYWPMFQHDVKHTGRSTVPGPSTWPVEIEWKYKAINLPKPQVILGPYDELPAPKIYLGAGRLPICAINEVDGSEIWCTEGGSDANTSSPAIGVTPASSNHDYIVYMGARDNKLKGYYPDGTIAWSYKIPWDGDVYSSTAIGLDGTIYTACGCLSAGIVHALVPNPPDQNGLLKWKLQIGGGIRNSSPALREAPGTPVRIYIGTTDGELWAIDDMGNEGVVAWWVKLGTVVPPLVSARKNYNSSPSIGADGSIYIGSNLGIHKVIDQGTWGQVAWTYLTNGEVDTTPAIGAGGMIVASAFKTGTRTLYALNPNGTLKWGPVAHPSPSTTGYAQSPSPVIDVDGVIYAGFGERLKAFEPDGTVRWTFLLPTLSSDTIAMTLGDRVLYVGTRDKHVYAIRSQ